MRLICINSFLQREWLIHLGAHVDHRTSKVLEFCDDETTDCAILSHRWIDAMEVGYDEMVDRMLANTCCIDKKSSAELSEAINSMYRWYGNAKVCYAYLHAVGDSSFPTEKSNGWPEWFSRG